MNEDTTATETTNTCSPYRDLPPETTTVNSWATFWVERIRNMIRTVHVYTMSEPNLLRSDLDFLDVLRVFERTIRSHWIEYLQDPSELRLSILLGRIDDGLEELRPQLERKLVGLGSNYQVYEDRDTIYY